MTPPSSPRAGEPRTEAGRRLWDSAHGLTRLDKAVTRDKARDLIREEVLRIEAEARAGEAALDRLRLELNVYDAMPVHEYTEETIRSAEGRIIIAAREVARRAGEAEGGGCARATTLFGHMSSVSTRQENRPFSMTKV
jgi:hypothetical protein